MLTDHNGLTKEERFKIFSCLLFVYTTQNRANLDKLDNLIKTHLSFKKWT